MIQRTGEIMLHPMALGTVLIGIILFVALGGNVELLWIPGAAAFGAALGSDRARVPVRSDAVRGTDEVALTATRAERKEHAPTVGRRPARRPARARDRELVGSRAVRRDPETAPMPRPRERSTDDRRRRP